MISMIYCNQYYPPSFKPTDKISENMQWWENWIPFLVIYHSIWNYRGIPILFWSERFFLFLAKSLNFHVFSINIFSDSYWSCFIFVGSLCIFAPQILIKSREFLNEYTTFFSILVLFKMLHKFHILWTCHVTSPKKISLSSLPYEWKNALNRKNCYFCLHNYCDVMKDIQKILRYSESKITPFVSANISLFIGRSSIEVISKIIPY